MNIKNGYYIVQGDKCAEQSLNLNEDPLLNSITKSLLSLHDKDLVQL